MGHTLSCTQVWRWTHRKQRDTTREATTHTPQQSEFTMRLLTHNTMKNNSADAKGKGFPLQITATEIRVDNENVDISEEQIAFVKNVVPIIDWPALVQAAAAMGVPTLPDTLTEEMAESDDFLKALYNVLMNIHLVKGILTCPTTGRKFPVQDGIPNMILQEEDCENVRY